jgi:uncharacterized protein YjbJ (UPF0337 family)
MSAHRQDDYGHATASTPWFIEERDMNWDRAEGNWKQVKGKIQEQWGKLTDDELDEIAGKRDQLVGRIQERYGIQRDEADKRVTDWERRYTD